MSRLSTPAFHTWSFESFQEGTSDGDGNALHYEDHTSGGWKGEYVVFRAEMDLLIVMSTCPSEIFGTGPTDAHFDVLGIKKLVVINLLPCRHYISHLLMSRVSSAN